MRTEWRSCERSLDEKALEDSRDWEKVVKEFDKKTKLSILRRAMHLGLMPGGVAPSTDVITLMGKIYYEPGSDDDSPAGGYSSSSRIQSPGPDDAGSAMNVS